MREGRHRAFQTRAAQVLTSDGELVEWLGTSTDVDDLQTLRRRQDLLLAELQHRVRNILALVRSLALRTARTSRDMNEYCEHLVGRLGVMARLQSAITRSPDGAFDVETLLRDELLEQTPPEGAFTLSGPRVELPSGAAELLALVFHELATNAVKYGAISAKGGRLAVTWSVEDGRLRLEWRETGVAVLSGAPRHEGFGTELITRRVPFELRGRGEISFGAGGVTCRLELPIGPDASPVADAVVHARP